MTRALILNADFIPLHITSAERALCMVIDNKAEPVVDSAYEVHSQHLTMRLPSVVRLIRYINIPSAHSRSIPLTTRTVIARDQGKCAYCGFSADTVDHIVPRSKGGKHVWENVVAACRPCNGRKRDRTPEEANMPLLFNPSRPRGAHARLLLHYVQEDWVPYLLQEVPA